jgi:hypothetical protein
VNRLTTLLLLLGVVGLGVLVWLQTEREVTDVPQAKVELFEGLDVDSLTRIRIDNIERSIHVSLDRDSTGRWVLTDPIAYPVREDMFVQLLGVLGRNEAWRVPASQEEGVAEELEVPRVVLELFTGEGGATKVHELRMGGVDADGQRINAICDGRVVRTWRNIETVLETSVQDWRSRRVFDLGPHDVIEIRRAGIDPLPDALVELGLVVRRDIDGWRVVHPRHFQADPGFVQMWSTLLARVSVDRFVSDMPEPDLEAYGLEAPAFTLTLLGKGGREETLEVGKPTIASSAYYARRSGSAFIWTLDERDFSLFFRQPEDLFDTLLVRLPRENMERIQLRGETLDLRLTQNLLKGRWTVAWRPVGSGEDGWTTEVDAAQDAVEGILATLGQERGVAQYLWDAPVEEFFPAQGPRRAIWVESGGARYGGRLGDEYVSVEGTPASLFLREREDVICLVPPDVAALLDLEPEDLISLQLTELSEPTLQRIEIQRGDVTRAYKKTIQTTWLHADLGTDALPELLPVIEHLFFLRAQRHVPRPASAPLEDVVTVRIYDRRSGVTQFDVGCTPDGEVRAQVGSRQSVLGHAPLHADLIKITGG